MFKQVFTLAWKDPMTSFLRYVDELRCLQAVLLRNFWVVTLHNYVQYLDDGSLFELLFFLTKWHEINIKSAFNLTILLRGL